jgi:hypothetical protein
MSTFRAFQTGLEAGQQQAKTRRQDDARRKATEAYGMGNYEGAVTGLMSEGLTDEASNFNTLGQQAQTRKQQQGYATALGGAPDQRTGYQNLRQQATAAGDPDTILKVDEALKGMDADQAAKFGEGMEFLGKTALGLKQVPPEARGQAAIEAIQSSPYANPQILQQIQQAAADGKITDEELDNFAMQTMSVADRVKMQREAMPKPAEPFTLSPGQRRYNPDGSLMASAPESPKTGSASDGPLRNLTPEEVRLRGYPAGTVVQVDGSNREFVRSRSSTAQGGQPTESERAAGLHAQVSLNGLRQLMAMEQEGYNRAGVTEQLFGSTFGLEKERLYDQSADEFIDGYLRAMTGAAATKQEIDTYKKQWFPTWGDTPAVIAQKSSGRLNAIQAMKSKAGRSWNPSWDALLNGMQGQGASSSPMQMATDQGAETVPGMNWNGAQMNYQSPPPADDLSQMSTEDLERMLAEAEGR